MADVAQRQWIGRADTCFIASGHGGAGLDASPRGGAPGFVEVLDERHIAWPDHTGNSMFQTLGNLAGDPRAGLVFVDSSSSSRSTPSAKRAALCHLRSNASAPSPFNP